jgi:hypothetical protein
MPQAAYPGTVRAAPLSPYLALLRVGFTLPSYVATDAVRSYHTISPLPARRSGRRRYAFCCTFRRLTPPRSYLALCPMEPGLSSPPPLRRSDCLADSAYYYIWAGFQVTSATWPESTINTPTFKKCTNLGQSPVTLPVPGA